MIVQGTKSVENVVTLGEVKIGQVFRPAHLCLANAISDGTVYMRINRNDGEKRVFAVSLDGTETRLFDPEHRVVVHNHKIVIEPN